MSEVRLSREIVSKQIEAQVNNYKTVLGQRDKDYGYAPPITKGNTADKMASGYFYNEKKVSTMMGSQTEASRSSSAIRKKRKIVGDLSTKKSPILKCKNLVSPTSELINKLVYKNKDERYRYLIKNAIVHYVERESESIYVELPQIPNILIIYRKPEIRIKMQDTMDLEDRGLNHIPLLEGEEKLVKLVLKTNKISKIENLVSLPNLESLDLGFNVIREISNLNTLEKLKHLSLRNNIIDSIFGLGLLKSLETIDFSSNKIKRIERLEKCVNLKSMDLSGNFISVFEGVNNLSTLEDLNISNNKIALIKETKGLISIKKLNLSNNFIDSGLDKIKNLDRVTQFWIENNPICKRSEHFKQIKALMPNIVNFNGKKATSLNADKSETTIKTGDTKDTNNVIKIIHKEWDKEVERLKQNSLDPEKQKEGRPKERCFVQSGHAEIESNKLLFIYGNAMEVLKRTEFYDVVEEMHLE